MRLTFLQNVEVFPEDVADVERRALQQAVSSLVEQVGAAAAVELRRVDALEREVLHGPLQPQPDVFARPPARICSTALYAYRRHVVQLRVLCAPLDTKRVISETFLSANLLA